MILPQFLWHIQAPFPWPSPDKRLHHNKHEVHIKVQIKLTAIQDTNSEGAWWWTQLSLNNFQRTDGRFHSQTIIINMPKLTWLTKVETVSGT
jgi:hypothetical protein